MQGDCPIGLIAASVHRKRSTLPAPICVRAGDSPVQRVRCRQRDRGILFSRAEWSAMELAFTDDTPTATLPDGLDARRPPLTVLLGPARAGKTATCLARYRAAQGRALLLAPSRAYAARMKERLQAMGGVSDAGGILTFGELVNKLTGADKNETPTIRRTFQ